jgi:hypothetical protein
MSNSGNLHDRVCSKISGFVLVIRILLQHDHEDILLGVDWVADIYDEV